MVDGDRGAADEENDSALVAQGLGALASGSVSLALAAINPAVAMAVGSLTGVTVQGLAEQVLIQRHAQGARAWGYAAQMAGGQGLDEEALARALTSDPARVQLLGFALDAATGAVAEAKLRMLGQALASGALAADDAALASEHLMVRALADLEAPHLRLLEYMYPDPERWQEWKRSGPIEEMRSKMTIAELRGTDRLATSRGRHGVPHLAPFLDALLGVLRSHGLVDIVPVDWAKWTQERERQSVEQRRLPPSAPQERWQITVFGCRLVERYHQAGAEALEGETPPDS